MPSNRFTVVRPQEFQQTYDPFPLQEMMQLAQYKQGRQDQINAMLGKAAGEAGIEGGYLTQDLAREITKERISAIDQLTDQFHNERDMGKIIQGIAKTKQQWQTDPRVTTVKSDRELMPLIGKNLADPDYGTSMMYRTYDDTTGQFSLKGLEDMASRGETITPMHYGAMQNVGDLKAYSPFIDRISADISQSYEIDPTDGIRKHKETNQVLDYETFLGKSTPLLSGFRNDDGSINMEALKAIDPVMAENTAWKAHALSKENRTFSHDDLVRDYMNIAALSFKEINKEDGSYTNRSARELRKQKEAEEASGLFSGTTSQVKYTISTATNDPAETIKTNEDAAKAVGINPHTGKDDELGYSIDDLVYAPSPTLQPEELRKYQEDHYAKVQEYTNKVYKNEYSKLEAANPKVLVNGQWQYSGKTPEEMTQEANANTTALMVKHRKLAAARINTEIEVAAAGQEVPKWDENGNIMNLTGEEKRLSDKATAFDRKHQAMNAFVMGEGRRMSKADRERIMKEKYTFSEDEILTPSERVEADFNYTKKNGVYLPNKRFDAYYKALDSNVEKEFGQQEFTTIGYNVYSGNDSEFQKTEVPASHKKLIILAKGLAETEGVGIEVNGIPVNAIRTEGPTFSGDGRHFNKLFVGDGGETEDFTGGDGIKFQPYKFYFNTEKDKWFMQGYYHTTKNDEDLTSTAYDVDITGAITSMLSDAEMRDIMANDRAADIVNGTPKGTTSQALMGISDKIKQTFGDIRLSQTPSGYYRVNAKFNDPNTGEMTTVDDYLYKLYTTSNVDINPRKLTKEQAKKVLSTVYTMQQEYDMGISDGIESYAELKVADNQTGGALSSVFNTIASVESLAAGGYDAMNQGGTNAGRTAINGGNSKDILGTPLSSMTVKDVMELQSKPSGSSDRIHAAGKYQIIGSTLKDLIDNGLTDVKLTDRFDAVTQDKLALALLKRRLNVSDDMNVVMDSLRNEWVGLQNLGWNESFTLKNQLSKLKQYYR